MTTLDPSQKDTLAKEAKKLYPNEKITIKSFRLFTSIIKFECGITFQVNSIDYNIRGKVTDFTHRPLRLKFDLKRDVVSVLKKRTENRPVDLSMGCELEADTNENTKKNVVLETNDAILFEDMTRTTTTFDADSTPIATSAIKIEQVYKNM